MSVELYKEAALRSDQPEFQLKRGDVVMVVDKVRAENGSLGYAVEVFNAVGDAVDVHFLPGSALEPLREDEVFCVRQRIAA